MHAYILFTRKRLFTYLKRYYSDPAAALWVIKSRSCVVSRNELELPHGPLRQTPSRRRWLVTRRQKPCANFDSRRFLQTKPYFQVRIVTWVHTAPSSHPLLKEHCTALSSIANSHSIQHQLHIDIYIRRWSYRIVSICIAWVSVFYKRSKILHCCNFSWACFTSCNIQKRTRHYCKLDLFFVIFFMFVILKVWIIISI